MAQADAGRGPERADAWLVITPTYRGDREQFALLNESFQRFAPPGLLHQVIVDRCDLPLFEPFRHDRMRLTTAEAVLPGHVRKLTVAGRSAWVSTRFPPVRNWIAQQLMKIAAACAADRPFVLFADSDVVFLRPFGVDRFTDGHRVALSRVRAEFEDLPHWRQASARLLKAGDPGRFATVNYVSNLIPWRRDTARAMVARVEAEHRGGWAASVARELRFSEYTLYGVFAEEVLGLDDAGHYPWDDPILNMCWDEPMASRTEIDKLLDRTLDDHIGAMFHSKAPFHPGHLRAAVESWWAEAR